MNSGDFLVTGPMGCAGIVLKSDKVETVRFFDEMPDGEQEKARFGGRGVSVFFDKDQGRENSIAQSINIVYWLRNQKEIGPIFSDLTKHLCKEHSQECDNINKDWKFDNFLSVEVNDTHEESAKPCEDKSNLAAGFADVKKKAHKAAEEYCRLMVCRDFKKKIDMLAPYEQFSQDEGPNEAIKVVAELKNHLRRADSYILKLLNVPEYPPLTVSETVQEKIRGIDGVSNLGVKQGYYLSIELYDDVTEEDEKGIKENIKAMLAEDGVDRFFIEKERASKSAIEQMKLNFPFLVSKPE